MPESVKTKVVCPECSTEVELVDGEGRCSKCRLDVGYVVEKRRVDRAIKKMDDEENKEKEPPRRKSRFSL